MDTTRQRIADTRHKMLGLEVEILREMVERMAVMAQKIDTLEQLSGIEAGHWPQVQRTPRLEVTWLRNEP